METLKLEKSDWISHQRELDAVVAGACGIAIVIVAVLLIYIVEFLEEKLESFVVSYHGSAKQCYCQDQDESDWNNNYADTV